MMPKLAAFLYVRLLYILAVAVMKPFITIQSQYQEQVAHVTTHNASQLLSKVFSVSNDF